MSTATALQPEIDDERLRVIGTRSGDRIALGDRMRVTVDDVSVLRRTVYGRRVVEAEEARAKRPKREVKRTGKTAGRGKAPARKPSKRKKK